jgi:hypothetical protein
VRANRDKCDVGPLICGFLVASLLSDGLRRGTTIAIRGPTSLLYALLAGALQKGAWCAIVGLPHFGAVAAEGDYRLPLDRIGLIPVPGPDWHTIVAALIDGVDRVVIRAPAADQRIVQSLAARGRHKGTVLLSIGAPGPTPTSPSRPLAGLGPGPAVAPGAAGYL